MGLEEAVDGDGYKADIIEFKYLRNQELDDEFFDDMRNRSLKNYVVQLPPRNKKILWLKYWQNFSVNEISLVFECSSEEIEGTIAETLNLLRKKMFGQRSIQTSQNRSIFAASY
ncbi:MAG: sigma-70 family RNA polymerase sigma factor [Oligoflexales bacterium]|nr:sigma-70 family RNA polymerase sigma factor [Oligoflexales bacterium]